MPQLSKKALAEAVASKLPSHLSLRDEESDRTMKGGQGGGWGVGEADENIKKGGDVR